MSAPLTEPVPASASARAATLFERGAVGVFGIALAVRVAVVLWAASRFPPVEDGHFYHVVAGRIARGLGYTWLWPDGSVTYAAHYPVGYPALLASVYAIFGAVPGAAMLLNAVLGSLAAAAAFSVVRAGGSQRAAWLGGLLVALHPALVAYTPALMTEGATASLLVIAGWLVVRARVAVRSGWAWRVGVGLVLGLAVLVRPQSLLLAPLFGALALSATAGGRRRALAAALVSVVAVSVCLPWTARNCARMGRCVFVSANGGWNLLIGTAREGGGSWVPIEKVGVPEQCRAEFREAFKDACFGEAAVVTIREAPLTWLRLIPAKLSSTFDYSGAPGWYLHASNPVAFDYGRKVALGTVETVSERGLLAIALLALARRRGPRASLRRALAVVGAASLLSPSAWPAYLVLIAVVTLLGRQIWAGEPLAPLTAAVVATTAFAHAVFFGAGRYSLVCFPFVAALAALAATSVRGSAHDRTAPPAPLRRAFDSTRPGG